MRWILLPILLLSELVHAAGRPATWFEQLVTLSFGNQIVVTADKGIVNLDDMREGEYWRVVGKVQFFPGEWIDPGLVNERIERDQQAGVKPVLLDINQRVWPYTQPAYLPNYGTYVLYFKSKIPRDLELKFRHVFSPISAFLVQGSDVQELYSKGTLRKDPSQNENFNEFRLPLRHAQVAGDFLVVVQASTSNSVNEHAPSLTDVYIGTKGTLNRIVNLYIYVHGTITGGLLLAAIFYAFIFSFRTQDRTSLYLCLYALCSCALSIHYYFGENLPAQYALQIFTTINMIGIMFLSLYMTFRIRKHISKNLAITFELMIVCVTLSGIIFRALQLYSLASLTYLVTYALVIPLTALGVFHGLRQRIGGTGYFIGGVLINSAFQFMAFRNIFLQLNEGIGFSIVLASLFMTIALALVNAKEFADTYRGSLEMRLELERLVREIKEKEEARTIFYQNTSHELRTPLNGIIGFMQLVTQNRYGSIPEAVEIQLQKCIRLAISLKNQVNTILDLAKSKKGNLSLSNSIFKLQDLSKEAEDLAEGLLLKRHDSSFKLEREWDLQQNQFIGDKDKIATIIRNLLGNAFKFCDPERPNHVCLSIQRINNQLIIVVSDSGIGIAPEHQSAVFEEFQQVTSDARRAYEGTGLGLAMVRDYVKLMGGSIELKSHVGQGSSFKVIIPAQTEINLQHQEQFAGNVHAMPMGPGKLNSNSSINPIQLGHGRLLVIDDNEMNCEVLRDLLEQAGYEVRTCLDGKEALKVMQKEPPALVLLDMMMPFFSGEDVLKAMQADELLRHIPVILITARASDDDRLFGLSLGADDYLAKPIHQEELLFRVKNLLLRLEGRDKIIAAEEGFKNAQLGRMMQEYSHELKNILQSSDNRGDEMAEAYEGILKRIPLGHEEWPAAAHAMSLEKFVPAHLAKTAELVIDNPEQQTSKVIRSFRVDLALLELDREQRQSIWRTYLKLKPGDQKECEQTLYLIRSFMDQRRQSSHISELVFSILDYARPDNGDCIASLDSTFQNLYKLMRPRLQRCNIELHIPNCDMTAQISQVHLAQIMLNIFANACDAVESLQKADRWIRVSIKADETTIVLNCANGGKPIPPEDAQKMLTANWSSKGTRSNGLGLGICQRLLKKSGSSLTINTDSPHPDFVITLRRSVDAKARRSA